MPDAAASWWAKKLGTAPQPQATPDTWNLPRHQTPTPAWQPPPQAVVPVQEGDMQPLEDAPPGQMHVGDAILRWRGGKGTHQETNRCPKCYSANYFSRREGSLVTASGSAQPAPHCYACGYNGLFEIFGGD